MKLYKPNVSRKALCFIVLKQLSSSLIDIISKKLNKRITFLPSLFNRPYVKAGRLHFKEQSTCHELLACNELEVTSLGVYWGCTARLE